MKIILNLVLLLAILTTHCFGQNTMMTNLREAPTNGGFQQEGYWVWGSSVIKGEDHLYHMYVSRWPQYLPFHPGWMIASEIVHAVSETPEGPYRFSDVALGARGAQYWDGRSSHNPKVVKYKDTYILYYMGSTHPFEEVTTQNVDEFTLDSKWCIAGRWRKRIGIATAKSPYGPWERLEAPILDVKPDTFYSFLTSNPSPLIKDDGSVVLLFKGRGYQSDEISHGDMSVSVATAPSYKGPYVVMGDEPLFSEQNFGEIEDPHLWSDRHGYHMVAKDQRGRITGEAGDGLLAHSKDGLTWVVDQNPQAYTKTVKWDNGKIIQQGQLERPFVLVEEGEPTHIFFATMDGPGGFKNGSKTWNMVIPLK
ncbi:glycoside hydrolase family protein [Reichenbachiella agarivorans]|uniref:Glycoside hydrolase family protein n=1 Tax=Reichenbachiella agarivorans TaxID=2979464 RepID=A0ABY6CQK8_9BACT|nr:glycoside hydrolase family protein [Reichenbachiella agarivorans]UXP32644.1 glycoside hydrolase family protein [Reichenbachiella agarivorans]